MAVVKYIEQLQKQFGLRPIIATEIEFYLLGSASIDMQSFESVLNAAFENQSIAYHGFEKERGAEQYEIALKHGSDITAVIEHTNLLKSILAQEAKAFGIEANFTAKPYSDQPGSGLHVHVHLEDNAGQNVYYKRDDEMSDALRWSLSGLMKTMKRNMSVFAPLPESMARFSRGSNAPTTISWGANNRTTALRLPDNASHLKHIEHRVAGADADVEAVIGAILEGILYGLEHQSDPGAQIYGDASLEMYGLERFS